MGTISEYLHYTGKLKEKIYIYNQRYPNKIIKTFLIAGFFHLPPVSTTPVVHFELRISTRFETALMRYWGNWFKKKNLKAKISWHCTFKGLLVSVDLQCRIYTVNNTPLSHMFPHPPSLPASFSWYTRYVDLPFVLFSTSVRGNATGPKKFIFCRLYPFSPQPPRQCFGSYLSSLYC